MLVTGGGDMGCRLSYIVGLAHVPRHLARAERRHAHGGHGLHEDVVVV